MLGAKPVAQEKGDREKSLMYAERERKTQLKQTKSKERKIYV